MSDENERSSASTGSVAQRDIAEDARQWLAERRNVEKTHHYGCHMRRAHEACLVERLLGRLAWAERERDSLRVSVKNLAAYARTITLTDAERDAVEVAARFMDKWGGVPNTIVSDTLRALLGRTK